jgi:hypothetical protein
MSRCSGWFARTLSDLSNEVGKARGGGLMLQMLVVQGKDEDLTRDLHLAGCHMV